MEQLDEQDRPLDRRRWDGQSVREWMNVAAAVGALLVGIVSFWTTARISGLEDYLRSEIGRRNSELNSLADQSKRLQSISDNRSERLVELQASSDALSASFAGTQLRLQAAQVKLSELALQSLGAQQQVATAKAELSGLKTESKAQLSFIDLLNRQRTYQAASFRAITATYLADEADMQKPVGPRLYEAIAKIMPSENDNDLIPYYRELRTNSAFSCAALKAYAPTLPLVQEYPSLQESLGRRGQTSGGKGWEEQAAEFRERLSAASKANDARGAKRLSQLRYAADFAQVCLCDALASTDHPSAKICPGVNRSALSPPAP